MSPDCVGRPQCKMIWNIHKWYCNATSSVKPALLCMRLVQFCCGQVIAILPYPIRLASLALEQSYDNDCHTLGNYPKKHGKKSNGYNAISYRNRDDSRFAPCQWETSSLWNDVSHWLGANLESALHKHIKTKHIEGVFISYWIHCVSTNIYVASGPRRYVPLKCIHTSVFIRGQEYGFNAHRNSD